MGLDKLDACLLLSSGFLAVMSLDYNLAVSLML